MYGVSAVREAGNMGAAGITNLNSGATMTAIAKSCDIVQPDPAVTTNCRLRACGVETDGPGGSLTYFIGTD